MVAGKVERHARLSARHQGYPVSRVGRRGLLAVTFVTESSFTRLSRAAVWVLAAFGVVCLILPFFPDDGRPTNQEALYAFAERAPASQASRTRRRRDIPA